MRGSITIARRELLSYFYSPMAYVAMGMFIGLCAFLFWDDFQPGQPPAVRNLLDWMVWILVFIVPVLTMGLVAQELSSGTIESMMTAPVQDTAVVTGKFLGAYGFFCAMLAPTLVFVAILAAYSSPDAGPIISGYLGILLVGLLFFAVGIFCSTLTRSHVVSAVVSAVVLFLITIMPWYVAQKVSLSGFWRGAVSQFVFTRYADFSKGLVDLGHVVFFVGFAAVFLFAAVKVLESRRWR